MALTEGPARDLLIAVLVVGGVLLALFLYTGNWPPPVVVESNSMMHVDPQEYASNPSAYTGNPDKDWGTSRADGVPYGRIGTIDPGDLVLVKEIDGPESVDTYADHASTHYGDYGEVIVYFKGAGERGTPIIHRAMTYIEVEMGPDDRPVRYIVRWSPNWEERGQTCQDLDGRFVCIFDEDGVLIPEIGWSSRRTFSWSGFVTQGDNVVGNRQPDQIMGIFENLVRPAWVQGVARGELPWFGLIKLAFTGNPQSTDDVQGHPYYVTIGAMTAPRDLWVMLLVGLVVVGLAPVGIDYGIHRVRSHMARSREDDPPPEGGTGDHGDGPGPPEPPAAPEPGQEGEHAQPEPEPDPTSQGTHADPGEGPDEAEDRVDIQLE